MLHNENLDPFKFVLLVADLLTIMGHTNVRVTDGPGDGGRDIHSLDLNKKKHLTQCKFHKKVSTTCTSTDVAELPMAMVKLGYTEGMFATNSKISPQAKREFLDNYSQLKLDFLDGNLLVKKVSESSILQALWVDGDRFKNIKSTWVFPFIIRRHANDDTILIKKLLDSKLVELKNLTDFLVTKYPKAIVNFGSSTRSSELFHPYRPPQIFTQNEGVFPFLYVNEVRINNVEYSNITNFSENLVKGLACWLGEALDGFSVRIGKPHIIPLEGINPGGKVDIDVEPVSFIVSKDYCGYELDWFNAEHNEFWNSESDARTSEAEIIRLYNDNLDVCLKYEITCKISNTSKTSYIAIREKRLRAWNSSVFALVEKWEKNWPYIDIAPPDDKILWTWNDKVICGWLTADLKSDFVKFDDSLEDSKLILKDKKHLNKVLNALKRNKDFEILNPTQARHMIASLGQDPFFEPNDFTYITAEVVYYPEDLPSPIHPMSRKFALEMVIEASKSLDKKIKVWMSKSNKINHQLSSSIRDDKYNFICLALNNLSLENKSSSEILKDIHIITSEILSELNELIKPDETLKIKTKSYWKSRYGITFGLHWTESQLPVVWMDGKALNNKQVAKEMGWE